MPVEQPYRDLGAYELTAVADPSGFNPFGSGYATIVVDSNTTFRTEIPLAEIYHMFVNAPAGTAFQIWRGQHKWDYVLVGANAWDPAVPMPIRSGDIVYFYFNQQAYDKISGTVWLREPYAYMT